MSVTTGNGAPNGRSGTPLLEVDDLRVWFPLHGGVLRRRVGWIRAVDGVSFSVDAGQTLGLVGESGCGKTTTGRAIVRLVDPTSGSIRLAGEDLAGLRGAALRRRRRGFQMVFQDPYSSLDPRQTVGDIVGEPLVVHGLARGVVLKRRVAELLERVGLDPAMRRRYPHEFSGGQRQRIGIARAIAVEPELIVCDEPISALDVSIQAQVINLLERLQRDLGLTYLFIAHDLSVVRHICSRVAVMYLGTLAEVADSVELYEQPRHPYTAALLSAVPVPDARIERRRRRIILAGEIPSPADPPSGCRFHTRCWLRERLGRPEICVTTAPELVDAPDARPGHLAACHFAGDVARLTPADSLTAHSATGRPTTTPLPASAGQATVTPQQGGETP